MAPATVRRAPYKDFLQPALQRRFSTTATILLGIAYLEAIFLASWNSYFWSWFPLGSAGIRTCFLFLCGLVVIILRIAQYHVGIRTSNSGLETFAQNALKLQTLETAFSYILSSWLFSQIYLWSLPDSANLRWITYHTGDRARLNEKALFLTAHFVLLGVAQAVLHLFYDADRLALGVVSRQREDGEPKTGDSSAQLKQFVNVLPSLLIDAGNFSLTCTLLSLCAYFFALRSPAWHLAISLFRLFYNLPRSNLLPVAHPFSIWVLLRCFAASFLLSFVWQAANAAFSIFLAKEPLKNGKPLTSDSKDPNGSLLNGLKSKKLSIRCFAMWELAYIARDFDVRRKQIYEDIDRKDGPMWSQVCGICLETVKSLETQIDGYGKRPAPPPAVPVAAVDTKEKPRVSAPLKEGPIVVPSPPKKSFRDEVEKAVAKATTQPGQGSRLSPMAKKAVADAQDRLLAVQREVTGADNPNNPLQNLVRLVLEYPFIGYPFRQTFNRRLTAAVLAHPYGEPSLYINAANALSQLSVHSLAEDKFGNVQRDIPAIIRTFTAVTKKLEGFRTALPAHWTDLKGERQSPEVDGILGALKDGLGQLVAEFGPYSRELRLSLTDMRLAKEAVGVPSAAAEKAEKTPEMEQVR